MRDSMAAMRKADDDPIKNVAIDATDANDPMNVDSTAKALVTPVKEKEAAVGMRNSRNRFNNFGCGLALSSTSSVSVSHGLWPNFHRLAVADPSVHSATANARFPTLSSSTTEACELEYHCC